MNFKGCSPDLIRQADVVVVNAEQELDRETIVLMTCAKEAGKAVLTVLPLRLHAHEPRNGKVWIHPFFLTFSDQIVKSFQALPELLPKSSQQHIENSREFAKVQKKLEKQFKDFENWVQKNINKIKPTSK